MSDKEREARFMAIIKPNFQFIYTLTAYYTNQGCDIDENYNAVLMNFYRYIHTYRDDRPLKTWLHSVTKNFVWKLNRKAYNERNKYADDVDVENLEGTVGEVEYDLDVTCSFAYLADKLSDDVREALLSVNSFCLSAFLLSLQGYNSKEIAEIEYSHGRMETPEVNIVKRRIFECRKALRGMLTRDGKLKTRTL